MTTVNCCFYFQIRLIQTCQTGGQWYSDTSPISIPYISYKLQLRDRGCCQEQTDLLPVGEILVAGGCRQGYGGADATNHYVVRLLGQCYKTFYDRKLLIFVIS